jgi:hypothetical protein
MQVDWISGVLAPGTLYPVGYAPYSDRVGRVLVLDPDGSIQWQKLAAVTIEGSHETSLFARTPDGASLQISGNPCKFFQGHNLFGSTDHAGLWLAAGQHIRSAYGLFPGPQTWAANGYAAPRWTRLDLTRSYRFADDAQARAWLRDVAGSARSRRGGALLNGSTCYWNRGSRRWEFKAYLKSDELRAPGRGHRLPSTLPTGVRQALQDWAAGVVRFELTLKALELQRIGEILDPAAVWQTYFERVTWNRNAEAAEDVDMIEQQLPNHLAGYLARWRTGQDLRQALPHRTFYRTRRAILEACGVDIAEPPPARDPVGSARLPGSSVILSPDAPGWDPEPLKAYLYEPDLDGKLKRSYGLIQ